MVRRAGNREKGKNMKKFIKDWLPKVAVVVVGLIVANEVVPYYNTAKTKIKTAVKGA